MKGLIIKDFLVMGKYLRTIAMLGVLYIGIGVFTGNMAFPAAFIAVMMPTLITGSFGYDEQAKWERYGLSMPLSRRDVVASKYLLSLILSLAGMAVVLLISVLVQAVRGSGIDLISIGMSLVIMVVLADYVISLTLPCLFKFGYQRGRIALIFVMMVPLGVIILSSMFLGEEFEDLVRNFTPGLTALLVVIAVLVILPVASYRLSMRIYRGKEVE